MDPLIHPLEDPENGNISVTFENQSIINQTPSIRQRQNYGTNIATPRKPPIQIKEQPLFPDEQAYTSTPRYDPKMRVNKQSWSEWWELFKETKRWKMLRKFLSPVAVVGYIVILWLFWLLTDFQVVTDGEAYGPKTKCAHPLILFKDSSIRLHRPIPMVDLANPDYVQLNNVLTTSACYLKNYAKNMSCITPLAYGQDLRIISMRRKNGDIIHLLNPQNPSKLEREARIAEISTLLPNEPSVIVGRPMALTIEYMDSDLKSTKKERFELADAFCISSSLDLFDHVIPQLGNAPHVHHPSSKN